MNQSIVKNNARRQDSCSRSVVSGVRSEGVIETRSQCSCKTDTESVGTEQRDGMHDARRGNTLFDAPRVSSNDAEKEKRINLLPDTGGGGGGSFSEKAMGDGRWKLRNGRGGHRRQLRAKGGEAGTLSSFAPISNTKQSRKRMCSALVAPLDKAGTAREKKDGRGADGRNVPGTIKSAQSMQGF